jgi:GNAT superfamily N-acetyltransferase
MNAPAQQQKEQIRQLVLEQLGGIVDDTTLSVRVERRVANLPIKPVSTLCESGVISEQRGIETEIHVHCGSEPRLAKLTYMSFTYDQIAYIDWIEVRADRQREGIGSELRETILRDLRDRGVRTVYSKAMSKSGEELMRTQGFSPSTVPHGDRWYSFTLTQTLIPTNSV